MKVLLTSISLVAVCAVAVTGIMAVSAQDVKDMKKINRFFFRFVGVPCAVICAFILKAFMPLFDRFPKRK
ncbi:MAG: hypothetical protein AAB358_01660 [Patescibacteria group bacterium]